MKKVIYDDPLWQTIYMSYRKDIWDSCEQDRQGVWPLLLRSTGLRFVKPGQGVTSWPTDKGSQSNQSSQETDAQEKSENK